MQAFKQGIVEPSGTDAGLDTKHNPMRHYKHAQ